MTSPSSSSSSPSSSGSSSTSSVHPSSLIPSSLHPAAIQALLPLLELSSAKKELPKELVNHLVDVVIETVDFAMGRHSVYTPKSSTSSAQPRKRHSTPQYQKFTTFTSLLLTRAEVTAATLLVSLIYIHRARPHLHIALEEWALERVLLGGVIVASKYSNDSTLKNVHWALCTSIFGKRDIGRIEREFLDVLDWELGVKSEDVEGLHVEQIIPLPVSPVSSPALSTPTKRHRAAPIPISLPTPSSTFSDSDTDSDGSISPQTPSSTSSSRSPSPKRGRSHHHKRKSDELIAAFPSLPLPMPPRYRQYSRRPVPRPSAKTGLGLGSLGLGLGSVPRVHVVDVDGDVDMH